MTTLRQKMNGYKIPIAVILFVLTLLTGVVGAYVASVEKRLDQRIDANTERYKTILEELRYIRQRIDETP